MRVSPTQGAPGDRPGARQVGDRGAGHPAVGAAGRQRAGRQGDRQCRGQRAEQRRAGPVDPRGRHRLRRRGPDRQAHPAARPGACVPNPQAHQPHHGDRREPAVARGPGRSVGRHGPRSPRAGQQGRRRRRHPRPKAAADKASGEEGAGQEGAAKKAPSEEGDRQEVRRTTTAEASDAKGGSE